MNKIIFSLLIVLSAPASRAQSTADANIKKSFLILSSTADYAEAKATAEKASELLKTKLDLRGLTPDKKTGLTFDKKTCLNEGPAGEYPCYNRRGKYDDGSQISIEYSSAYKEMKPGFYVVVAYSGEATQAASELKKAKSFFKDAYIKKIMIFMGGE